MRRNTRLPVLLVPVVLLALASCSLNKLAVNVVAGTLASGESTVFTGDDDPELVADALPFAMKLYESLAEQAPDNAHLLLTTGSVFAMYANAFIQTPASMLPDSEFEQQMAMQKRAKKMYLRGRGYVLRAIELRHPGFGDKVAHNEMEAALASMRKEDVPYLVWGAVSWLGAFSTDTFDMELLLGLHNPLAMLDRALALDEGWSDGMIHDVLISIYGSLPESMGGSQQKAREHFQKAVEFSHGLNVSPYVALATTVCVATQNVAEFRELLGKALAIDPDANPGNRLANLISQNKARWLLAHVEDFFLLDSSEESPEEGESE
jgi:predicted anti-sigma-YlaC factor YlaD